MANEVVFHKGAEADSMFFIVSGELEVELQPILGALHTPVKDEKADRRSWIHGREHDDLLGLLRSIEAQKIDKSHVAKESEVLLLQERSVRRHFESNAIGTIVDIYV